MANYSAGTKTGIDETNNFIIDPKYYIDEESKQYVGTDLWTANYLGDEDLVQAENFLRGVFNIDTAEGIPLDKKEVLIDLGLWDGVEDWNPQVAELKWEGYKTGVKSSANQSWLTEQEADDEKIKLESHMINWESSFLKSDFGQILLQESATLLNGLQLQRNTETGELVSTDMEFYKSPGSYKTKSINISDPKKLRKHLTKLAGGDESLIDQAFLFYKAIGEGSMNSSYGDIFLTNIRDGKVIKDSSLYNLGQEMRRIGKGEDYNIFVNYVAKRKAIGEGVKRQSVLLENPDHLGELMSERHNMHLLLSNSTHTVNNQDIAVRRLLSDPDADRKDKQQAIEVMYKKWIGAGKDGALFKEYLNMWHTYTPALTTVNTQF